MPEYLILDEPVDGLDPLIRRIVWDTIVGDVAERKMTVLISSHNLRELDGICETVGILYKGKLIFEKEIDEENMSLEDIFIKELGGEHSEYKELLS